MLEPKEPTARNGPNTGCLAPGVKRRVNKKKVLQRWGMGVSKNYVIYEQPLILKRLLKNWKLFNKIL